MLLKLMVQIMAKTLAILIEVLDYLPPLLMANFQASKSN
jgi:hypothetical protein